VRWQACAHGRGDDGRLRSSDGGSTTSSNNPPRQPWRRRKPNIIFIMADDLGYSDLGAFGSEIRTPNLDALVKQGRILANHHAGGVRRYALDDHLGH
jgi:arylsulfatase